MRLPGFALALVPLAAFQLACDPELFGHSDRYREDFEYSYNLKPGGKLNLENFNGSVEILSWEKDSVLVSGTKHGPTEELLKALKIEVEASERAVRIRTVRPSAERRGNMGARYFIRVPRRTELEKVVTSNGSIRIEDIDGSARLETSNGSVRLRKLTGRADVRTSNAGIEADDVEGGAVLGTSNGSIRGGFLRGRLEATTSNASINLRLSKPVPREPIRLQTSNGSIELAMETFEENDVRAATSNSSITLRLPATLRARVNAATSNGPITTDFEGLTKGMVGKHRLEGTIGTGGALIDLTTSNGAIRVLRL